MSAKTSQFFPSCKHKVWLSEPNTMDIFLHIPSELACFIASSWLCVKSVVLLDAAYCNKVSRAKLFATILNSNCCVLSQPLSPYKFQIYLDWVVRRSVRINFVVISPDVDLACLETYLRCNPHVGSVNVHEVCDHKDGITRIMSIVAQNCMKLRSLVCKDCVLTESVQNILASCTQLEEIRFIDCPDSGRYNAVCPSLQESLKLKTVELLCGELSAVSVLQHRLSSCERLSLSFATELPIYKLVEQIGYCSSLVALAFTDTEVLTDDMMVQLVALCPQLLQLHLEYCGALTDIAGAAIAENLTQLKELKIVGCFLTDISLSALAHHRNDSLTSLNVRGCSLLTSAGHNNVLAQCLKLHTYSLSYIPNINPALLSNLSTLYLEDIRSIASFETLLSGCSAVQRLFLGLTATNSGQLNFTCLITELLPNLRVLSIMSIWSARRAPGAEPPTLQELRLLRPKLIISYNKGRLDDT